MQPALHAQLPPAFASSAFRATCCLASVRRTLFLINIAMRENCSSPRKTDTDAPDAYVTVSPRRGQTRICLCTSQSPASTRRRRGFREQHGLGGLCYPSYLRPASVDFLLEELPFFLRSCPSCAAVCSRSSHANELPLFPSGQRFAHSLSRRPISSLPSSSSVASLSVVPPTTFFPRTSHPVPLPLSLEYMYMPRFLPPLAFSCLTSAPTALALGGAASAADTRRPQSGTATEVEVLRQRRMHSRGEVTAATLCQIQKQQQQLLPPCSSPAAATPTPTSALAGTTASAGEKTKSYEERCTAIQQHQQHRQHQRNIATTAAATEGGGGTGGGWTPLQQRSLLNAWHTIAIVEKVSATPIRPMTIKRLLQLEPANEASLLKGAEWIREELPVRLSHRLYDFHRLPLVAVAHPLIFSVYESYLTTFDRTRKLPPISSAADLKDFIKIVEKERSTHDRTVDYMGQGVRQLRRVCRDVDLNPFLERFFYFRIGRRVMIDQLVHLQRVQKGWRGIIHLECHAAKVIEQRARDVREACRSTYGLAPPILLTGNVEMRFATIPDHLALIITEILKNAVRATVEFHTMGNSLVDATTRSLIQDDEDLPEVKVEVYKGKREVVIKISDKGGGVPPAKLTDMWSFGERTIVIDLNRPHFVEDPLLLHESTISVRYSTVTESNTKMQESSSLGASFVRSDMAGYGFGLPLARAFARYFGGDIHVQSHFGIGTDVYITLNHIGDQEEALYFEERSDLRLGQKVST